MHCGHPLTSSPPFPLCHPFLHTGRGVGWRSRRRRREEEREEKSGGDGGCPSLTRCAPMDHLSRDQKYIVIHCNVPVEASWLGRAGRGRHFGDSRRGGGRPRWRGIFRRGGTIPFYKLWLTRHPLREGKTSEILRSTGQWPEEEIEREMHMTLKNQWTKGRCSGVETGSGRKRKLLPTLMKVSSARQVVFTMRDWMLL